MAEIPLSINPSESVRPLRDLADTLEEIQTQTQATEKSFQNAFGKSTDSVDKTTSAIEEQTKAQKKNADAVDQVEKGVVDFSKKSKKAYDDKDVDNYTKSVKQADQATDELDKSTKGFGDKAEGVFQGLGEGLSDIGGQFGDIGSGIVSGQGGGILSGLDGILGKLGPIGIAAGAVVGSFIALGSELLDIDQHFDELRGKVEQLFKVTGEEADHLVVNIEAIANTFEQDVDEVLLTTNTLMKEFGVSAEEATNLLQSGLNSSANAQGDLIDSVKEFSAQVRASGGDAQDLFSILQKSNEEGIFSDKGIDVVKEFGLRIREQAQGTTDALQAAFGKDFTNNLLKGVNEGSISSIDALKQVSAQLGTLEENSKEAQTVIADVFGGAGEDAGFRYLTLLKDIGSEQDNQNKQLTEEQKRKQETLDANKRLAAAQNELSKAIGDSSAIGRVWTDIQATFIGYIVDIIKWVNDLIDSFESWDKFQEFAIKNMVELADSMVPFIDIIDKNVLEWDKLTKEEKKNIGIKREAIKAIRDYGKETGILVSRLEKQFTALKEGSLTDEARLKLVKNLNEQYSEQIGNVDLLTASEEQLLEIKQNIIKAEIEADIARKKSYATQLINNEIIIRQEQLKDKTISANRRKVLEDEIKYLENQRDVRLNQVEEEVKIQLGLIKIANDDIVEDDALTEEERAKLAKEGADKRKKIQDEYNKAIQEILKRGRQAELNDLFLSEEDRINIQRDAQREELANLLKHAQDLHEQLTGSRELDQEVINAFNRADEKIITDAQDKITEIYRKAAEKQRQIRLAEANNILGIQQQIFDQEVALLEAQQAEELALIDQQEKTRAESTLEFENRIQLQKLDTQAYYLSQRIKLIDQEEGLKLEAINNELKALEDKEGAEVEAKRIALEQKKELIMQETNAQKAGLDLQLQNTENAIAELENKVPTLGEVFDKISEKFAESLGLSQEQVQAIASAVQQVYSQIVSVIQQGLQEQLDANDKVLEQLDKRKEQVQQNLDNEIAYAKAGYAANVQSKRQELAQIEEEERQAQKVREDIIRQQQLLDNIQQVSSLTTASANLYSTLSPLPFGIGIALATALTAAMFTSFIATKAKARNVATLAEGGHGDDTGLITGKRHSQGGEAFLDHIEVEDGEMWSVFNRKGSKKYADLIKNFTEAVNNDRIASFLPKKKIPEKMLQKNADLEAEGIMLQSVYISNNLKEDMSTLSDIKSSLDKRFARPDISYVQVGGDVYKMEIYPNGRKVRTKLNISVSND